MMSIKHVAVIGSGVMGSGIAAHIANAGISVDLLDIVPEGAKDRDVLAKTAIQKMLKTEPAAFMHKKNAKLVRPGNLDDHMDRLAQADWIIEVIIENLELKHKLYENIHQYRKADAIVSSNTSTIPLKLLAEKMPVEFQEHFLITHFFNPPRYMPLLEIVAGEKTKPEIVEKVKLFADIALGKGCVDCNDTPGFAGNRIGIYWLVVALNEAIEMGMTVEEADAILGKPVGIPKTGVFGLFDLIGIDLMPHIAKSMLATLPKDDDFRDQHKEQSLILNMIKDGYTGRKGKGGFYRLNRENGKKVKESIDLQTGVYAPSVKPSIPSAKGGLAKLLSGKDKVSSYARRVLLKTLSYAASLVPEIADDICAIDNAMQWGYNWKFGPFEMIDKIGVAAFQKLLEAEKMPVPELILKASGNAFYDVIDSKKHYFGVDGNYHPVIRPDGVLLLEDIARKSDPILKTGAICLWDIGDGVACLQFTTKMNSIDQKLLQGIDKAIDIVGEKYKALVIHNESTHFSAGANLGLALFAANVGAFDQVEELVAYGQKTYQKLKRAPFPVVGAPAGMALGGGCEILLHCDAVQAHAESYIGLVEVGVGIIPGWGGCKEMLHRFQTNPKMPRGPIPAAAQAFENISMAKVSKSALEAKELLYLRHNDGITMNKNRLLADAKARALSMVDGYEAPEAIEVSLPGPGGKAAIQLALNDFQLKGLTTPHDLTVADHLGNVLSGEDTDLTVTVSEDKLLELELKNFMQLAKTPESMARMEHILETGKPLRN